MTESDCFKYIDKRYAIIEVPLLRKRANNFNIIPLNELSIESPLLLLQDSTLPAYIEVTI